MTANLYPFDSSVPVLGFVAYSGTGKTTLLEKLIPALKKQQIQCAVIKSTHHHIEMDKPGKDSYRLKKAGAAQTLLASKQGWSLMVDTANEATRPTLQDLIHRFDLDTIDLILVEGFKNSTYAKIELHRVNMAKPFLYSNDPDIIAIITDSSKDLSIPIPVLDINNIKEISQFIIDLIQYSSTYKSLAKP